MKFLRHKALFTKQSNLVDNHNGQLIPVLRYGNYNSAGK